MPPKSLTVFSGRAGAVFDEGVAQIFINAFELRRWATGVWSNDNAEKMRRKVTACADAMEAAHRAAAQVVLPDDVRDVVIHFNVVRILGRPTPRHLWRDNLVSAWWAIVAVLTDRWEATLDVGGEDEERAAKVLDDLTTAIDVLRVAEVPDRFGRLL